jgi:hypothetical protein
MIELRTGLTAYTILTQAPEECFILHETNAAAVLSYADPIAYTCGRSIENSRPVTAPYTRCWMINAGS